MKSHWFGSPDDDKAPTMPSRLLAVAIVLSVLGGFAAAETHIGLITEVTELHRGGRG